MADEVDLSNDRIQKEMEFLTSNVTRKVASFDPGEAGECYYCGEHFSRVVYVRSVEVYCCGKCRDRRGLE